MRAACGEGAAALEYRLGAIGGVRGEMGEMGDIGVIGRSWVIKFGINR